MGILEFGMVWFLLNLLHTWNLLDADERELHVEHCMCMLIVDIHGICWILTDGHLHEYAHHGCRVIPGILCRETRGQALSCPLWCAS